MAPTPAENSQRAQILGAVRQAIVDDIRIPMVVGSGPFRGCVGEFTYQFEGEDDLLHLFVERATQEPLSPGEAQDVVSWLLPEFPSSLIWVKPGVHSQHFYLGHDELLKSL